MKYCQLIVSSINKEMKDGSLICYGFEKAEMPDGKNVTKEWNANGRIIEKRVRAKR